MFNSSKNGWHISPLACGICAAYVCLSDGKYLNATVVVNEHFPHACFFFNHKISITLYVVILSNLFYKYTYT